MIPRAINLLLFALALCVGNSLAAVNFVTSVSSLSVAAGGQFEFNLQIQITADEQVTGLDYYWQISLAGSGLFSLVGRDAGSGQFPEETVSNTLVLAAAGNILNPANDKNLGAGVSDVFVPLSTGSWLVAHYTFRVDPAAAPGIYTLSSFSPFNKGWVGPTPFFDDFTLNQQAAIAVAVVPEPGAMICFLGALLLLFGKARREAADVGKSHAANRSFSLGCTAVSPRAEI